MEFQIGVRYSVDEIQKQLRVGNAGGIRVCLNNKKVERVVLFTADPSARIQKENPYHDRIEGDILVYSAGGLEGDQSLAGVNKRLVEQSRTTFPIYGFRLRENRRKVGLHRWEFIGLLQFLRVYPDAQIDRSARLRKVWLFEFRICTEIETIKLSKELSLMLYAVKNFNFDAERESRFTPEAVECQMSTRKQDAEAIERVRANMLALNPLHFELLVKSALESSGFSNVVATRYSQDGGIDVSAHVSHATWPIAGLCVQVQVKRWLHTVGRREVAELRGSLAPFAQGAVVTTSYFSRAAVTEAKAIGRQPIVLIDGFQFATTAFEKKLIAD
ncbi:MAG: restriction endonuclease [Verrucomicrobiaceae bacterium]|nr:restriction endonuclease [Verrucomicrobiaceae bacterium]